MRIKVILLLILSITKMSAFRRPNLINTKPVILFIPRLLPNISKQFISKYFLDNKIGIITDINAKYRVNENNYNYWFAFLSIQFLDTSYGKEMFEKMIEREETVFMTYNKTDEKYWEISIRSQDRGLYNKKLSPKPRPSSPVIRQKQQKQQKPILKDEDEKKSISIPIKTTSTSATTSTSTSASLPITSPPSSSLPIILQKQKPILEDGEIDEENILDTNFTFYDHLDMYKDFMKLEKEIFGNNVGYTYFEEYSFPKLGPFVPLRI